jgi:16S rRNA (guanine966-N2)-methyltransferase
MRIISGEFKSRILKNPKGRRTHPMSERIRGALFNSLGDISGQTLLDAYAGTGAIAIEALSRGAEKVHAVEMDADAFDVLQKNRNIVTDDTRLQIHRANIKTWLKNIGLTFDIIVADPPYNAVSMRVLEVISSYVNKNGLLIISLPQAEHFTAKGLKKLDEKRFGNAKLVFYRKMK